MAQTWVKFIQDDEEIRYHLPAVIELLEEHAYLWAPHQTIEQVSEKILNRDYQLWAGGVDDEAEIYGLTQYLTYPNCTTLAIIWCAGDNGERYFSAFTQQVELLGSILGAACVEIHGRTGWKKQLHELGYKATQLILVKDISNGQRTAESGYAN